MAELHRYPLRVQQSKLDEWRFVFVDEVPGRGVFGPNYQDLLDRLTVLAGNLLRTRGKSFLIWKLLHQITRHYTCPIEGPAPRRSQGHY